MALVLGGCSTLAEPPPSEECKSDSDCVEGYVCALDQGRCLPGNEAAPRAHLGFDIRERAASEVRFRVEVDGCDCAVQEAENIRELSLRRSWVSQQLELEVSTTDDADLDLPATFEISQPSRFALLPSPQRGFVDHAIPDEDGNATSPAVLGWPRYHLLDEGNPRELILWTIEPEGSLDLGLRYHGLRPPRTVDKKPCVLDTDCCDDSQSACDPFPNYCDPVEGQCTAIGSPQWTYSYPYETTCSRSFSGSVYVFDASAPPASQHTELSGANVRVRYDDTSTDRFGIPVFSDTPLSERPPQCEEDDDCSTPDEYCDRTSQQCFLALAGLLAGEGSTEAETGTFRTFVYTYCDDEPTEPQPRRFGVTIQPPSPQVDMPPPAPLPSVDLRLDANFLPGPAGSGVFVGEKLCVPDWGPPVTLELELSGEPRTLLAGATDEDGYTCCDVGCLPATDEEAQMSGPPTAPSICDQRTSSGATASVSVSTDLVLDLQDIAAWGEADCAVPEPGRVGSLSRLAACTDADLPCRAEAVAMGTDDDPRVYQVRVESPVGSVLASGDYTVEIGGSAPELQSLALSPRVLVTGVVDVDSAICGRREAGEDCAAREALVIAERLRMPDEPEGGVPGPYLHTVSTFYDPQAQRDGAFVLPLDPGGVYVVTALPATGAEGGPAGFTVVNLRADAPEPLEPLRLVLEDGVLVTLKLEQFDPRTTVAPIDRGSYLSEGKRMLHPARLDTVDPFIDLNRVGECWTVEGGGPEACKIRRLIPPGSDLSRSQVEVVRFTARRSDKAGCLLGCPTPRSDP